MVGRFCNSELETPQPVLTQPKYNVEAEIRIIKTPMESNHNPYRQVNRKIVSQILIQALT